MGLYLPARIHTRNETEVWEFIGENVLYRGIWLSEKPLQIGGGGVKLRTVAM